MIGASHLMVEFELLGVLGFSPFPILTLIHHRNSKSLSRLPPDSLYLLVTHTAYTLLNIDSEAHPCQLI
jgi:hypothetical protein